MENILNTKKRLTMLCLIFLSFVSIILSCKKENSSKLDSTNKVLSRSSPDLDLRLRAIKGKYEQLHLEVKLQPKLGKELSWVPDWKSPKVQVVNDSVSYVFYKLIGQLERNGKKEIVKEMNGATYLMVKNEKEFYRAFYFKKGEGANNEKVVPSEIKIEYFTGKLLLSNLENGSKFLLDYNNGSVSGSNKKLNLSPENKLQTMKGTVSYYETECHTEVRSCQFTGSGYSDCGGNIIVVYSQTCQWPQPFCGVTFSLTDYNEERVCDDVWFPDPPTDPENPGGSGGYDDGSGNSGIRELNTDAVKEKYPCADKNILQPIFGSESMSEFVAPFLTDQRPTLTYNTASLPWGSTTTGGKFELGHAGYDPNSGAGLSSVITFNEKMLENSSPLFAAVTTVHETIHGYINYNISMVSLNVANNYSDYGNWMAALNGFYLIKDLPVNYAQHTVMLTDYFDKAVGVVTAWDQNQTTHHTAKEIAMAMMYGLDTVDPGTPQSLVNNINSAFELMKIKYGVTDAELDAFNKTQLNSIKKIPTECN